MTGWIIGGIVVFVVIVATISTVVSKLIIGGKEKLQDIQDEIERQRLEQERKQRERLAAEEKARKKAEEERKRQEAFNKKKRMLAEEVADKVDDEIKMLIGEILKLEETSTCNITEDQQLRKDVYQGVIDHREKERIRKENEFKAEQERKKRLAEAHKRKEERRKALEEQAAMRKKARAEAMHKRKEARQAQIDAQKARHKILRDAQKAKQNALREADKIKREALANLGRAGSAAGTAGDYSKEIFEKFNKESLEKELKAKFGNDSNYNEILNIITKGL